ncbi:NAD(P)H oxidoreductase [Actinocorallia populi]|uniref:NAD(P)H oxidoreductase n=1 Tax=Actinocorallia populi TaxID=2079200 RepID=UPI000D08E645|nr:NAD(P)H oxidoreductase [Actinocorallia populi]
MTTALLVVAHHRGDSLTAHIADRARLSLEKDGRTVDLLDLHAEGFDPRMTPEDEPDWGDRDKEYSAEVRAHMRRIDAADLIVVVFPVWWYGPPALLKGWIDRVWNYGFAYGRSTSRLAGKRMLWLALAGESREAYAEHGLDAALTRQLQTGISRYCGIEDTAVRFVYDTVPDDSAAEGLLTTADGILADFLEHPLAVSGEAGR